MKRIATQKNSFGKRLLINIPFVLLVALMIAFFGGGALLLFYAFVCVAAFKSAMIFLILFGSAAILVGAGLALVTAFKKYYAFYNKKMGWTFADTKHSKGDCQTPLKTASSPQKTVTENNSTAARIKKFCTLPNISLVLLAFGSVLAIISAALGCINRENWVEAIGGFKENLGYYADVNYAHTEYYINSDGAQPIGKITVDRSKVTDPNRKKTVTVIYTEEKNFTPYIAVDGYQKFDGDFKVLRSADGTLKISIGNAPKKSKTIERLLFFVFNDYSTEKQIVIRVPSEYRHTIDVSECDIVLEEGDIK